ncbi:hypothetical protein BGZ49_002921 [Haplosporangium sp. Z 27]|nr:hypothetical protein BGZ49_002921 [Haplosporangium sp. Z 27]
MRSAGSAHSAVSTSSAGSTPSTAFAVPTLPAQPPQSSRPLVITNLDLDAIFTKLFPDYRDEVLKISAGCRFIIYGKSFLKRLATVHVNVDYPGWDEGILSEERNTQVSQGAILAGFSSKGRNEVSCNRKYYK